jgi:hypothetical protein
VAQVELVRRMRGDLRREHRHHELRQHDQQTECAQRLAMGEAEDCSLDSKCSVAPEAIKVWEMPPRDARHAW